MAAYLGPSYTQVEIERRLTASRAVFTVLREADLIEATADALADRKAVGWFQGRMEFGPRALAPAPFWAIPARRICSVR